MAKDISKINDATISIYFGIHEPIDMIELGDSFKDIVGLYKEFIAQQWECDVKDVKAQLRITSVRNNCISIDIETIVQVADYVLTAVEIAKHSIDFIELLSRARGFFKKVANKDDTDKSSCPLTKPQMKHFEKLTKTVTKTKDKNASVKLKIRKTSVDGSTVETDFEASSDVPSCNISYDDALEIVKGVELTRALNKSKLAREETVAKAISPPLQKITDLNGNSIYYRDGKLWVSVNGVSQAFPCTKKEYDKLIEDIAKSKNN